MRLVDDRRLVAAALVEQLHDVEAGRAAQHRRRRRPASCLRTDSANTVGSRAGARQPRLPPWSRVGRVGERRRDLREIGTAADLPQRFFGAAARRVDLVGVACSGTRTSTCAIWYSFSPPACACDRREIEVDLGVA